MKWKNQPLIGDKSVMLHPSVDYLSALSISNVYVRAYGWAKTVTLPYSFETVRDKEEIKFQKLAENLNYNRTFFSILQVFRKSKTVTYLMFFNGAPCILLNFRILREILIKIYSR